jgi:transposase
MSLQDQYDFSSLDPSRIVDSPELPEMFTALLELYRGKCRNAEQYEATIQSLLNRLYGRKSEKSKYHPAQKLFFPELLEEPVEEEVEPEPQSSQASNSADENDAKPKRKGAHGRSKLPSHLERRVVEWIDMDSPSCGSCGEERPILRVENSERLNYIPARAIVDVTEVVIRGPLPCVCDDAAPKLVRPELPLRPIDRGLPGVELLAAIVIGKFYYHLPHYRQATKTLKDAGITISKQSLWDWTWGTAQLLEPLWELMRRRLLALDHLAADETPTRMNDPTQPGVPTKSTYLWQYFGFDSGEYPYTVFDFAQTGAQSAPKTFLGGLPKENSQPRPSRYRAVLAWNRHQKDSPARS